MNFQKRKSKATFTNRVNLEGFNRRYNFKCPSTSINPFLG